MEEKKYLKNSIQLLVGELPTTTPVDIEVWPEVGWDAGCLHYFTRRNIIKLMQQTGFEVLKIRPTGWVVLARKGDADAGY